MAERAVSIDEEEYVYRPCPPPHDEDGDLNVRYLEWVKEQVQLLFFEALHSKRQQALETDPDLAECTPFWDSLYTDLVQNILTYCEMEEEELHRPLDER